VVKAGLSFHLEGWLEVDGGLPKAYESAAVLLRILELVSLKQRAIVLCRNKFTDACALRGRLGADIVAAGDAEVDPSGQ